MKKIDKYLTVFAKCWFWLVVILLVVGLWQQSQEDGFFGGPQSVWAEWNPFNINNLIETVGLFLPSFIAILLRTILRKINVISSNAKFTNKLSKNHTPPFEEVILVLLKRGFDFRGRASRQEFWLLWAFFLTLSIIAGYIDGYMGLRWFYGSEMGMLTAITILCLFLPAISVTVRRLHDFNQSGWWYIATLIPVLGLIILITYGCIKGASKKNRFGDVPPTFL